MEATNYCRVVEMTHEDKVKMYNRLTKKELIEMLIEANNVISLMTSTPKVDQPMKLNESLTPPPVPPTSTCKTWGDCMNPFMDCINCPLMFKYPDFKSTTSTNLC